MYAVIETSGRQFIVKEGETIAVDKLAMEKGKEVTFDKVLLHVDKDITIGQPYVENMKVIGSVEEAEAKDRKLYIMKYKRKTGYLKKTGHRQKYTLVKINKISS